MVYSDLSFAYKRLVDTLGKERVSMEALERLVYGHDLAPIPKQAGIQFDLKPDLVVLPKSTQEVVRIVKLGAELEFPVVPRGGGTSLHGGSVPNVGGILLSTVMMNRVDPVDKERMSVTAQAGCTWKDVMDEASASGFLLPITPTFYRSSTVGGFLSNGGVGIGAYKYGPTSRCVRSLEVVLPDGEMVETGERDFDLGEHNHNLTNLFLGAEGTLGAITKATLKLVPAPRVWKTVAYSFESGRALAYGLTRLARMPIRPYHVSFFDRGHLTLQRALLKQVPESAGIALLAFEGDKETVEAESKVAHTVLESSGARALEDEVATILWEDRYEPYNARRLTGGLIVSEGLVPLSRLPGVMEETTKEAKKIKVEPAFHGFLVDRGSALLAPYILINEGSLRGQLAISFVERYHEVLNKAGGHPMGLGMLMTYNLEAMYGHMTSFMRSTKEAIDGKNLLNRGKLLGTMGRKPPLGPPELPAGLMRRGLRALGALRKVMPGDMHITKIRKGG